MDYDIRKDVFNQVPNMTLSDLNAFHDKYIKDKHYTTVVVGKKSDLNIKTLENYGEIKYLKLEEIFGY
jgi:zinc protease